MATLGTWYRVLYTVEPSIVATLGTWYRVLYRKVRKFAYLGHSKVSVIQRCPYLQGFHCPPMSSESVRATGNLTWESATIRSRPSVPGSPTRAMPERARFGVKYTLRRG